MSFADDFDAAFDELDPADARGRRTNYVTLFALRQALPQYDRKAFDAELNQLRRAWRYTVDAPDGRHKRMTRVEIDAGIQDWKDGPVLVYVARRPTENPPGVTKTARLGDYYQTGWQDVHNAIDMDYFDLKAMAKQIVAGQDRYTVIRAAVDVYWREAEEDGSRQEWMEQNAEELLEEQSEYGLVPDQLYEQWHRGWRDGAVAIIDGDMDAAVRRHLDEIS